MTNTANENEQNEDLRNYEVSFLLKNEDAAPVLKVLLDSKARILNEGRMAKIRLSYLIQKQEFAFFGYFHFEVLPEALEEIDKSLKLNSEILRHLLIRLEEAERVPAAEEGTETAKKQKTEVEEKSEAFRKRVELSNEELEKKLEEILS